MRFAYTLGLFLLLLAGVLVLLPESDQDPTPLPEGYTFDALQAKFGASRDLDHTETRVLYRLILQDISDYMNHLNDTSEASQHAMSCNALRWTARLYARSRDGTYALPKITDWMLQLRDSYVHGFRYLPGSLLEDFWRVLSGDASFGRSTAVLQQVYACLFPSPRSAGCPSYQFLRQTKGKTDKDVLASCTISNAKY
ncbi:hypothetical protein DQ04_06491060 [Trypanosoma grayi]|uniref:hypothetical protein n=1 Tax=Trypanosoma grayi TaxID=71804 RepID=UPI0004F499E6|nr:hypothetical protein DQ04_06491060 [Trypanosoma grayi]KEG08765.1 hypothetical protein DQ04_06491060 [Trypanosoma grayi]